MVRLSARRVAVPINPNADDPIHPTTLAPRSARRGPRSIPPSRSSLSRPNSGLWITPPAMPCAWFTMRPANETPGTTIRNSASSTTTVAASFGRIRMDNHSCTGAKIAATVVMLLALFLIVEQHDHGRGELRAHPHGQPLVHRREDRVQHGDADQSRSIGRQRDD